jgi:hypothetical protein
MATLRTLAGFGKRVTFDRFILAVVLSLCIVPFAHATVVFDQPHNGSGTLHKSSWYPPDGLDGDIYCWDSFTLASNTAITEVHWRGGYEYHPSGTGQSPVSDFEVSIYRSIGGGSQPDMGAGGQLVQYVVGGNASETAAGSFGGVAMFDYAFTLPSPFQAAAGTTYWVQIEASQGAAPPSYAPDWGLAVGTGGNNAHFRRITGGGFQAPANDLTFSLRASGAPTVTIDASVSPLDAGVVTGAGAYPIGSAVSLAAAPNAGWAFVNWTENGTPVSANANYTFTATVNRTLVANFVTAYTITTYAFPVYAGVITGGGVYAAGAIVTLIATPNPGFVFSSWSDGSTQATHTFPAAYDLQITAFFDSAPNYVTFDFDNAPLYTALPLDLTVDGLTGHFTGGYSTQLVGTLGIAPLGMSGIYLYPSSVFQSDLGISFSETLTDFSVLYAVDELACDTSARMRVSAYMDGAFVGTATMVAPVPGTYPSATLAITVPTGFNSVVVHWDAPGTGCQDYGPIFFADNVTVKHLPRPSGIGSDPVASRGVLQVASPTPNPFRESTTLAFTLPDAGPVKLDVCDVSGRVVRTLLGEPLAAGNHRVTWDGSDETRRRLGSGVYFLRLGTDRAREGRRVLLMN